MTFVNLSKIIWNFTPVPLETYVSTITRKFHQPFLFLFLSIVESEKKEKKINFFLLFLPEGKRNLSIYPDHSWHDARPVTEKMSVCSWKESHGHVASVLTWNRAPISAMFLASFLFSIFLSFFFFFFLTRLRSRRGSGDFNSPHHSTSSTFTSPDIDNESESN